MSGILLDTHVLIWLLQGNPLLGIMARLFIDDTFKIEDEDVYVSAITFWEAAMLMKKDRVDLGEDGQSFRKKVLELGIKELAITGDIGVTSVDLEDFHPDPADRMIVAASLVHGLVLVTADKKIQEWSGLGFHIDARI